MRLLAFACALLPALAGCGGSEAQISGTVTCQNKPVAGAILFSPKGEGDANTGPAVGAALDEEGKYTLRLKTTGPHSIVVTPRDVKFPVPPGERDYPCDRSPVERDVQPGTSDISIELSQPRR